MESQQPPMTPEEMLSNLRMGKKMVYEVRMGHLTIPMRVLTLDEENAIRSQALQQTILAKGDENDKNVAIEKATIRLATTITYGGVPMISDVILSRMTADEVTYLYNEWVNLRDRVNPNLEQIESTEFTALVECLKKNIVSPKELSIRQLRAICTSYQDLIQRQEAAS